MITSEEIKSIALSVGADKCSITSTDRFSSAPEGFRPTDDPYLFWDADNKHGMGIISMHLAAFNAGLGILGRNALLKYSSCQRLGYKHLQ